MKTFWWACAAIVLVASANSATRATTFVGSSTDITDFVGGSEVSTNGVLIDAVNLLNDNVAGVGVGTTINGVLFKGTQPGAYHEGADSFANASFVYNGGDGYADGNLWTSGGAYNTLADSQVYWISMSIGVINLVPAQLYELQIFMLDDRSGINKTFPLHFQQAAFTGNNDQISNTDPNAIGSISGISIGGNGTTQANGEIATIRFSIDAGFNGLLVRTTSFDAAINGMQLRQVPEPTGLTLLGMAMAGCALRTRRR